MGRLIRGSLPLLKDMGLTFADASFSLGIPAMDLVNGCRPTLTSGREQALGAASDNGGPIRFRQSTAPTTDAMAVVIRSLPFLKAMFPRAVKHGSSKRRPT